MLKVFLAEDETLIREGLRDNIPWEQYGYRFVGEAADGEMALPLIRKTKPDVLITDIKMPFMDGLSLSRIVREELPRTKIIIISGYDDFEYAREMPFPSWDRSVSAETCDENELKKSASGIKRKD